MSNVKLQKPFETTMLTKHEPTYLEQQFSDDYARIFNRQRLKSEVAEAIFDLLEESGTTKSQFAKIIGTSKSHVTQMLGGSRNFTLDSLADIFLALGRSAHVSLGTSHDQPQPIIDDWKNCQHWERFELDSSVAKNSFKTSMSWPSDEHWNDLVPSPFLRAS